LVQQIEGLHSENSELSQKVKKYESYFKELSLKDSRGWCEPADAGVIAEAGGGIQSKVDRQAQLKILNL
jgi:hypothetical protein